MAWKKVWLKGDNRTLELYEQGEGKAWRILQRVGDVTRLDEKPKSVTDIGSAQVLYARKGQGQEVKWIRNDKELKATTADRFYRGPRQRPSSVYE